MRIGIIVYSRSGHTLSVARKLEERLAVDGHDVTLEQLETVEPLDLSATTAALKNHPPSDRHDALVLGSPVNGGRMSAPMRSFLDQVPSLDGKRVAMLLTHFFPRAWGANQTIEEMTEVCESKGANVVGSGGVRWTSLRRRRRVAETVEDLSDLVDGGMD
jgi:multimeric flavodoxin WrbA